MIEKLIAVGTIFVIIAAAFAVFLILIWTGFRMGRRTVDRPLPPITQSKQAQMIEDDPYRIPMYGSDAASTPTVEERR